MALVVSKISGPESIGGRYMSVRALLFSNSYPTGGESLTPAMFGFGSAGDASFHVETHEAGGYFLSYDYTNQKIKVRTPIKKWTATYDAASLAAVTSRDDAITVTGILATDIVVGYQLPAAFLSGMNAQEARVSGADTITLRVVNSSAGALDAASGTVTFYTTAANGASQEVANATDLSAILTAVRVTGYATHV